MTQKKRSMASADDVRASLGRLYYNRNDDRIPPVIMRVEGWTRTSLDSSPPWRRVYATRIEGLLVIDHSTGMARLPAAAANILMENVQDPITGRKRKHHEVLTLTTSGELKISGTQLYFTPIQRPLREDMFFSFSGY